MPRPKTLVEELLPQGSADPGPDYAAIAEMLSRVMGGRSLNDLLRSPKLPPGMHRYWWNGETVVAPSKPSPDHYRIVGDPTEYEAAFRAGDAPLYWQGAAGPTIDEANERIQRFNEDPATAWLARQGPGAQAPYVWSPQGEERFGRR